MERHLTTFESRPDRPAGAGFLAFMSLAGGLPVPRTLAAAEALASMLCAGIWF